MSLFDFKAEDRFEAAVLQSLGELGISITIGTDFHEFSEILKSVRPDHPLGDPFDPDVHDMSAENACWIVGRDMQGRVMHLHALRVLPTGNRSVAEYFRHNFLGFSPPELPIDQERSRYKACPAAKKMMGRVVYSGEVWVGGDPGEYRGTGLINHLMRYAMLISMRRLGGEFFLGFVAKPQAIKGLALRFGYMHVDPLALRWYTPEKADPLEGVMVYMSDEDMRYVMELPAAELDHLAA